MKRFVLVAMLCGLFSQSFFESAYPLNPGEREVGIFQPLRYGLSGSSGYEVSTQPLYFFIMPNATFKKAGPNIRGWDTATRVHLNYPTLFFRALQKPGMFGLLPSTADIGDIPNSLFSRVEIIGSNSFTIGSSQALISLKGGVSLGISDAFVDPRIPIELPIVYHRMLVFVKDRAFNLGADFRLIPNDRISILTDIDIFMLIDDAPYWEHKMQANIKSKNKTLSLDIGYKLTKDYPRIDRLRMLPVIDVKWFWKKG